jgi:hypothetical protein
MPSTNQLDAEASYLTPRGPGEGSMMEGKERNA